MQVVKARSSWQITTNVNNPVNQLELEKSVSLWDKSRENLHAIRAVSINDSELAKPITLTNHHGFNSPITLREFVANT